jgi:integrase
MQKPKLSTAEYAAAQSKGTVAWVIWRYLWEMNGWGGVAPVRVMKHSQVYTLMRTANSQLGPIVATELTRKDVIEWVQEMAKSIMPATVNQYVCYLAGALKYAGSNPAWGCGKVNAGEVDLAKPFLKAHGLISKSSARTRRPTPEELEALLAYFEEQNKHRHCKTDMVRVLLWQNYSSRRISETCRLLWADWNRDDHTMVVRNMKDPRKKGKTKVLALTDEAQAFLTALWDIRDETEPRVFPYESKTCSQRHTLAKKKLAKTMPEIITVRLHDNRRDRCSKLLERGYTPTQGCMVSGHDSPTIYEHNYAAPDVRLFKQGPLAQVAP